jgi:KDO2-lipid IV(A) lauroyltransferase
MLIRLFYYAIILALSRLPFKILYGLSDFLFVFIYHLFKYRRKVVRQNLKNSFPNKSVREISFIEREFYRHLCDLVVESLKGFSMSENDVKQHMKFRNPELLDQYFDEKKSVVMVGGHYGNWEMFALAIDRVIKHKAVALYTPLANKFLDTKVRYSRSKYGLQMLSISEIRENMANTQHLLTATIFGSDQAPGKRQRAYWMRFLNQETAVQFGTEKFAKEYDMPVIYGMIHKMKRGQYEVEFTVICDHSAEMEYGRITQEHTRLLEKYIIEKPAYWLWSHKRWKRPRPEAEHLYKHGDYTEVI